MERSAAAQQPRPAMFTAPSSKLVNFRQAPCSPSCQWHRSARCQPLLPAAQQVEARSSHLPAVIACRATQHRSTSQSGSGAAVVWPTVSLWMAGPCRSCVSPGEQRAPCRTIAVLSARPSVCSSASSDPSFRSMPVVAALGDQARTHRRWRLRNGCAPMQATVHLGNAALLPVGSTRLADGDVGQWGVGGRVDRRVTASTAVGVVECDRRHPGRRGLVERQVDSRERMLGPVLWRGLPPVGPTTTAALY